jgi:hypothetical protein
MRSGGGGDVEAAFHALQRALTTTSVLQLPDFDQGFVVECDALGVGIGAVLHQGHGPIAFFSKQLAARHASLAAYERELICLVLVVRHWRPYLWGRPFTIKTDHYNLKFLLDQKLATVPEHQWVSKLFGFDFNIKNKPGTANVVADALSRCDTELSAPLMALLTPSFCLFDDLRQEFDGSQELRAIQNVVAKGEHSDN